MMKVEGVQLAVREWLQENAKKPEAITGCALAKVTSRRVPGLQEGNRRSSKDLGVRWQ